MINSIEAILSKASPKYPAEYLMLNTSNYTVKRVTVIGQSHGYLILEDRSYLSPTFATPYSPAKELALQGLMLALKDVESEYREKIRNIRAQIFALAHMREVPENA